MSDTKEKESFNIKKFFNSNIISYIILAVLGFAFTFLFNNINESIKKVQTINEANIRIEQNILQIKSDLGKISGTSDKVSDNVDKLKERVLILEQRSK